MERKRIAILLALVVGISALTITGYVVLTANQPDVRIGYLNQDLHQLALRVAYEKGWFDDANISVQLIEYGNGAEEMRGFQANQIDMGYLGAAPALTLAINSEIDVTILAAVNYEGSAIMVKKDLYDGGTINDISDLVGKTIYHPGPATVQNFLIRMALNQSGLSVEDVFLEERRPQDMAISLTDEAPAFIAWEPFPAKAEADGLAEPLMLSGEIWPRHPCCVVASSNSFLDTDPVIVQKVIDIHRLAEEYIVSHPEESLAIAVDWLATNESTVETSFNRIIYDYSLNRTGIKTYLLFLIDQDIVEMESSEADSFLDTFLDDTYALATCSC
ncbi:MAG: ABC transporter substrate-binding protein [Candidatus Thorarchaeota archaeon]